MLGFHPLGTQPLCTLGDDVQAGTQTVTLRYASQSFVTRSDDVPPLTFLPGRIKNIESLGRELPVSKGQPFASIVQAVFGEIILDNADGALDPLANDYFADGRQIRLKIGATEIVAATTITPAYIAAGAGSSSGTADAPDVLTAERGTYELVGQPASLFTNILAASQGSYVLSGQDATIFAGSALVEAEQGTYALSGQNANLFVGFGLIADQGTYTLSGQDANLSEDAFGMVLFGPGNGTTANRHYTIAHAPELDLIAATGWAWGMFHRVDSNTGSVSNYMLSSGNTLANPSFNLLITEASAAPNPNSYQSDVCGSTNDFPINSGAGLVTLNQLRLVVLQYNATTGNQEMWICDPGESAQLVGTATGPDGNVVAPVDWQLGRRSDGDGNRYWQGELGGLWKADRALSATEIEQIANGASPGTILSGVLAGWWPFKDGAVATEPDLSGNGNDATRVGTGW